MANAFSICSLAQHWRTVVPPGVQPGQGIDIPDPAWSVLRFLNKPKYIYGRKAERIFRVIAVNGVSLAFALIANLCLLITMARRLSFSIAQPIVIVGWYISSVLLICILAIISHEVSSPKNVNQQLTQAYYYGAIAAGIYFLLSSFLIITLYGAYRGHYEREFKLTTSQRTLMVQTIGFLVYMLAGSAIYSRIEGWRYAEAVFWADFTLLTIGLGQPAPRTHAGRSLLYPYAFGGIVIIGIVIGSVRSLVLERGKTKMNDRLVEKTRRVLAKKMSSTGKSAMFKFIPDPVDPDADEQERRRREFEVMRQVRQLADAQHRWLSLLASTFAIMTLWFIGAVVFWRAEAIQQWSYFESLYFSYTTLLTIGYGDVYPISNWGRTFFVFWSLLAVPTMTIFISNLSDTFIKQFRDFANFVGELTVLPGERSFREQLKRVLRPSWMSYLVDNKKQDQEPEPESSDNSHVEQAEEVLEQEQLREEEEARSKGDIVAENIHHYQYLLVRELRKMFRYVNSTPPKQFDYDEWAYYLRLLGEDESTVERHLTTNEDGSAARPDGGQKDDQESGQSKRRWSWLGHRSPLLGDKEEAEWLLDALAYKLETELRKLSDEYRRNQQQSEKQKSEEKPENEKKDDSGNSRKDTQDSKDNQGTQDSR
jgi:potassium channel subfamily K